MDRILSNWRSFARNFIDGRIFRKNRIVRKSFAGNSLSNKNGFLDLVGTLIAFNGPRSHHRYQTSKKFAIATTVHILTQRNHSWHQAKKLSASI